MEQKRQCKYRFGVVGFTLMLVAWLADSALDAWMEGNTLAVELFHPTPHELTIRYLFLVWQLIFLLYIARLFRKQRTLDQDLAHAVAQAEFERNKAQAVLEGLGDGISLQDPELRVVYQNAAHRAMVGEHLGEYCFRAYQGRDDTCPECHLVQSFTDGQVHLREASTTRNGRDLHVEIVSTPLFDGENNVVGGIESVRDITERKRAEQNLRNLASDLQKRTLELEAVNSELEAFSYSLSHDLRAYLTRINLATESLRDFCEQQPNGNAAFCLKSILHTCEEMDSLIAAMLALGRATRQELRIERIDLSEIATDIAAELAAAEPDRHIAFDIEEGILAQGDEQLLQVALQNLLGNACKYSRMQSQPRVTLKTFVEEGTKIHAVSDNGRGFDMREAKRLFQPFQRLSSSRSVPGHGIGLATVKQIIERHGGRIWAEAELGRGATFFFTLAPPIHPERKAATETAQPQAAESI